MRSVWARAGRSSTGSAPKGRAAPAARPEVVAGLRDERSDVVKRERFSSGSSFERDIGYSRVVVDGDYAFVSGTTGFDYAAMTISDSVVEQAEQACQNIAQALTLAGSSFADVVRVRYIVPNVADFEPCWPTLRGYFGQALPAATMISAGLSDPRMKIEIEVTARLDRRSRS